MTAQSDEIAALSDAATKKRQEVTVGTEGLLNNLKPRRRIKQARAGGFTVDLQTGREVPSFDPAGRTTPDTQSGIFVGQGREKSGTLLITNKAPTQEQLRDFVRRNAQALDKVDAYLGGWMDEQTGKFYIELSKRFPTVRSGTKEGEIKDQLEIFDIERFNRAVDADPEDVGAAFGRATELPIGNWREFINGSVVQERRSEMQAIGAAYLAKQKTPQWWKFESTVFEEIYGKKNLEVLAGFIAATSPTRNPQENLRTASEFMRRFLIGENIIQPHWVKPAKDRTPMGTMSGNPGAQIGNEQTAKRSLLEAAKGNIAGVGTADPRNRKTNNMARALLGDPDAVTLDRWWARLAEDPDSGVFTMKEEGLISGTPYGALQSVVIDAAQNMSGKSARDFSAEVWVGMRETAKNLGRVFNRDFPRSEASGSSKGIADVMEDLVTEKAKWVGMSRKEFEAELRKGNAQLLSTLIATPLGAYVFEQMMQLDQPGAPATPGTLPAPDA